MNHSGLLYISVLNELGIKTQQIKRSQPDNLSQPGVRVATMHRVKGLQFEYVILAGINDNYLPLQSALKNASDKAAYNAIVNAERSLIHVSATRAKRCVTVSYYGQPSSLIPDVKV